MNIDNSEKSCENCGNFLRHYIIERGKCRWVNCGHCSKGEDIKIMDIKLCYDWQPIEGTDMDKIKKDTALILEEILERLDSINTILKLHQ